MRRALVPLLTAAALHCGDASSDSAGPTATTSTTAGPGIADVTGPSAELVMMGYSMPQQLRRHGPDCVE